MKTSRLLSRVAVAFGWFLASCLALPAAEYDQRLLNLSSRAPVGAGDNVLIAGFVIGEGAKKPVLIRAIGPTLTSAGVTGVLAQPVLQLFNSSGLEIAANTGWSIDAAKAAELTNVFTSTGAFKLNTGTRDSALFVTLEAGPYTAQVSGVNGTTGNALLEIYDVSGSARLLNLSARSRIDSGYPLIIAGLVVATGSARHVLVRAVGPTLGTIGVANALADPSLAIVDTKNVQLAANNDWGTANTGNALTQAFAQAGAFALGAGSKDAALIADLPAGTYSVMVSGVAGGTGVALVEVYDLTPENLSTVSITAPVASTDTVGAAPGVFAFTRSGNLSQAVTVNYTVGGTALAGLDFLGLPGTVTFPAGVSSVNVNVTPLAGNASALGGRTVTVSIAARSTYGIGANGTATVTIFYNPGTLYVSNLRPLATSAGASTASGTATIQLSPDEKFALLNVSFANLSSPEIVAHLAVGAPGQDGPYVFTVPNGQASGLRWDFSPSGTFSAADLLKALKEGRIYLSIDTANFPNGELRGQYILSGGTQTFAAPPSPPALADSALTAGEAARFLTQATFGPTKAEIDALTGRKLADLDAWITLQMTLPASSHRTATLADQTAFGQGLTSPDRPSSTNRQAAWWKLALTGQDQLRQRVAFALSEIYVVSNQNGTLAQWHEGLANYYDLLAKNAFGNFRTLLEDVTLSPMMGIYLSHLRNRKATSATSAQPDENYAREIMQLFTIGLNQLQPDGTLKLAASGLPIPTYDNATITEMAKVFTGWSYYTATPATTSFTGGAADYINPMTLFSAFHEDGAKTIVTGKILPSNQGGAKDLKDALDTLFLHPNTPPFVCRQLIQRLVTSNPSPGYVYRVARVFEDNGKGVRGDLGAVIRAILLDYEARSPAIAATVGYGKLKEPLLRGTALLRAFGAAADNGRYAITTGTALLAQAPLDAPTVFNFFEPDYVLPGALAAAGLYAPEYQILTDTTAITVPNFLYSYLYATRSLTAIGLDLSGLLLLAQQAGPLADYLNTVFCGGAMPATMRARLVTALGTMPSNTTDLERVRSAIYLVITSPEAAIQK
ncbi:MAG: DUF1800 family protein [Opitutae bacterium]|nr:DUF1800 family protein [Opitutae bacterium]